MHVFPSLKLPLFHKRVATDYNAHSESLSMQLYTAKNEVRISYQIATNSIPNSNLVCYLWQFGMNFIFYFLQCMARYEITINNS